MVGTRTRRIFGQGPSSHRRPRCGFSRPHQAARAHRRRGAARDRHREGNVERVDLTLLSVDEQKLPVYLRMRRMPLCDNKPWPGKRSSSRSPKERRAPTSCCPRRFPLSTKRDFPR
jgi:hypothetical protein